MSEKQIKLSVVTQDEVNSTPIEIDASSKNNIKSMRLGFIEISHPCPECNNMELCKGHVGKSKLNIPIFKPAFTKGILSHLKTLSLCGSCGSIKNPKVIDLLEQIARNDDIILPEHIKTMTNIKNQNNNKQTKQKCLNPNCEKVNSAIQYKKNVFEFENENKIKETIQNSTMYHYFENLPNNFYRLISPKNIESPTKFTDLFYNEYIQIPSNHCRQYNSYNGNVTDHLTGPITDILAADNATTHNSTYNRNKAQILFDTMDSNKKSSNYNSSNKKLNLALLTNGNDKDSLLRSSINGKRFSGTARAVISPGKSLAIGYADTPEYVQEILSSAIYYNRVTEKYIDSEMEKPVSERDRKWKDFVKQNQFNNKPYQIINLSMKQSVVVPKYGDIFEATKKEGDYITLGRQPTLHRNNIQVFKIKKEHTYSADGKERTFAIPTMVASSFNADFDGDEMTAGVFNNPCANIEMGLIMNSKNLSQHRMTGTFMYGLVQDQIVGANLLSQEKEIPVEKALRILGEYIDCIPLPLKKNYTGKELITCVFPDHFTLRDIFDDGKLITENITNSMVSPNSYISIFNGVAQYYGDQVAISLLNIFKTIIENYIRHFGLSIKLSDIIPKPSILTECKLFVENHIAKINENINRLIRDINEEKIYISSFNEIQDVKEANIDVLKSLTEKFITEYLIPTYYDDDSNQLRKCYNMRYKSGPDEMATILCFVGQNRINSTRIPNPGINGKTSLYGRSNDLSLEACDFVKSSMISGLTYAEYATTIKYESLTQIVNVTSGTSKSGYMGKQMIKKMSEMITNHSKYLCSTKNIINFNPNTLKIMVSDMAKVDIIVPNKKMIWYKDLSNLFDEHLSKFFVQLFPDGQFNILKSVDFYLNLNTEIMTYYYKQKAKKRSFLIDHKNNKNRIKKFFDYISLNYYFDLGNIHYVLYIFYLYFDPSGYIFKSYNDEVNLYFSDKLLTKIFNKIEMKLITSIDPGFAIGYEVANTLQEVCTQGQLSSFHAKSKGNQEIRQGTTDAFRALLDLSKKEKESEIGCYSYDKTDLIMIKNLFEYISLKSICKNIIILEEDEENKTVLYKFNIVIPILLTKNINFSIVYHMFKNYLEQNFMISTYSLFSELSKDKKFLDFYVHVHFNSNIKQVNYGFDLFKNYLKNSFLDGVHKGKTINSRLNIDEMKSYEIVNDDDYEIKTKTLYVLRLYIESIEDYKYINTSRLYHLDMAPWHAYQLGGIEFLKSNAIAKGEKIINSINYTHCLRHFFDFYFLTKNPSNLKQLYNKNEIIKRANHGNATVIAEAALTQTVDECNDLYSSLLVGHKPKFGTGYHTFYINPERYSELQIKNIDKNDEYVISSDDSDLEISDGDEKSSAPKIIRSLI